ncbi:MAG: hypothetical protein B6243_02950 [Anaerolineaceae bacterium 4572_5.2]|nr:MAG: hypothetical protein B6243_02950 [Anaerolineaceae bacterium 4572_5.2]
MSIFNQLVSNHNDFRTLIMVNVIAPLDLDAGDQQYVNNELKWLFAAVDNFLRVNQTAQSKLDEERKRIKEKLDEEERQRRRRWGNEIGTMHRKGKNIEEALSELAPQIWRNTIANSPPVEVPIPYEAETLPGANNSLLKTTFDSQSIIGQMVMSNLNLIRNIHLNLDRLLNRETLMGEGGKRNIDLQNSIQAERVNIIQELNKIAIAMKEYYGIFVTSPEQLLEYLKGY